MLLSCYSREEEVLFGSIVQGDLAFPRIKQAETPERTVFTPTPVRVQVLSETSVPSWLKNLSSQLTEFPPG